MIRKINIHTIVGYVLIGLGFSLANMAFAQQKNDLLDREFWKSQPSIEAIESKITDGHSPTAMTRFNFDAIGYAILENNPIATIEFLLGQGNDINKLTHDGRTYVFWAAYKGNLDLMKYLVKHGAKTDIIDQHGYTLLMFAASTGQENTAIYDYCIKKGADLQTELTRDGRNALLAYAGRMKSIDGIKYFVKKGLDIHSKDPEGNGVFYHAAKSGNEAIMRELVDKYKVDISKNEKTNENAILAAASRFSRAGDQTPLSFYQYLESLGLDPAIVSNNGNTALINMAAQASDIATFEYFIEKGVDPNQINDERNNALILAATRNHKEVVEFLIKKTNDVNAKNEKGETALSKAIASNKLDVAEALIKAGAQTNATDNDAQDLCFHALNNYRGDLESFKEKLALLSANGYNLLLSQKSNASILHKAVKTHDVDLVKYLIKQGLDVNAKDDENQSVLHIAAMVAKDTAMLNYLVKAGTDKAALTDFDESAYDLASQNELLVKNKSAIEFLKI